MHLRLYSLLELKTLLCKAGMSVLGVYGGFEGQPYEQFPMYDCIGQEGVIYKVKLVFALDKSIMMLMIAVVIACFYRLAFMSRFPRVS